MIRSMTGFGRGTASNENNQKIIVEMKSVNHRYCDLSLRIPKKFSMFEPKLRSLAGKYLTRGKADVSITYEDFSETAFTLHYNEEMAGEYMEAFRRMEKELAVPNDVTASILGGLPEVLVVGEEPLNEGEWYLLIQKAMEEAGKQFVSAREREGAYLKEDLLEKLETMSLDVDFVEKRSPLIVEEYRTKLTERVSEFLEDASMDESRIAAEVTIYADKMSVDEEIVRLKSHILAMKDILNSGEAAGRKMDFLAQEMNREANTILSKSSDVSLSEHAIELKTNVEKVREQVQNIE